MRRPCRPGRMQGSCFCQSLLPWPFRQARSPAPQRGNPLLRCRRFPSGYPGFPPLRLPLPSSYPLRSLLPSFPRLRYEWVCCPRSDQGLRLRSPARLSFSSAPRPDESADQTRKIPGHPHCLRY